jgi:hypothetical protein
MVEKGNNYKPVNLIIESKSQVSECLVFNLIMYSIN